ncbi:plasma membrane localization protein [Coemansia sp. RSA 2320]|nr:plasma membrane localization protein [Coemansia sp. RSA 2320]
MSTSSHPPADYILYHPIFRRYVKHASLIERCFPPEKSGETVPNSNELSYLIYYVQSKPAKLTKVGAYLSKRIAKDVQRRHRTEVYVGLRIYNALLGACARDLNFFAKDVLCTLDTALLADDNGFTEVATETFALFCRFHAGHTLAIDKDLCAFYSRLITHFATCAQAPFTGQQDCTMKIEMGLRALQAVAESQATYATDCYYELPRIVGALLSRIASAPASMSSTHAVSKQLASVGGHDAAESLPDNDQLGHHAWRCLETLVSRSHGQHSRAIIAEIFSYLDCKQHWQPVALCVFVVTSAISQLQSQDQNMVIVETLALLADDSLVSRVYLDDVPHQTSDMVEHSPYILVGISAMEALNVLVAFMLKSTESEQQPLSDHQLFAATLSATTTTITAPGDTASALQSDMLDQTGPVSDYYHLLSAIGGLAKHQYYSDQLVDMAGYLVLQLRLDVQVAAAAMSDDRLLWILRALTMVLHSSREDGLSLRQTSTCIPLEMFAPLFTLLTHDSIDISSQAADCIVDILWHSSRRRAESVWTSAQHLGITDALYQKLGEYLSYCHEREPPYRSAGYSAVAAILCEFLNTSTTSSIQCTLELVDSRLPKHCSASWVTLLVTVWSHAAKAHSSSKLEAHMQALSEEARRAGCWDSRIEDVCTRNCRVVMVHARESSDLELDAAYQAAKLAAAKLSSSAVLSLLESKTSSSHYAPATENKTAEDKRQNCAANSADLVLRDVALRKHSDVPDLPNMTEHTRDIRARVSVDWETQARRDSTLLPQIDIGTLRAALQSGMDMGTSGRIAINDRSRFDVTNDSVVHSLGNGHSEQALELAGMHSANTGESREHGSQHGTPHDSPKQPLGTGASTGYGNAELEDASHGSLPHPHAGIGYERLDAYGQPVSSEICNLLDSIDEGELLLAASSGEQPEIRGSPSISTPVIGHFD